MRFRRFGLQRNLRITRDCSVYTNRLVGLPDDIFSTPDKLSCLVYVAVIFGGAFVPSHIDSREAAKERSNFVGCPGLNNDLPVLIHVSMESFTFRVDTERDKPLRISPIQMSVRIY